MNIISFLSEFFIILLLFGICINVISNPKIIIVGIQKSGTTSFHDWFTKIGLRSGHHRTSDRKIAELIFNAKQENLPLFHYLQNFDALTEMNSDTPVKNKFSCYYPQIQDIETIFSQYPSALYILNTRNITNQVSSMMETGTGMNILKNCLTYLKDKNSNQTLSLEKWIQNHNENIRKVFKSKPEAKFVEFSLESRDISVFKQYFDNKNVSFPHSNKHK